MVVKYFTYYIPLITVLIYSLSPPPPTHTHTHSDAVDPTHCFWVSQEYHQQAVEYICAHAPPPSDVGGANTEDDEPDTDDIVDSIASY